jgi:hypothetical protein
MLMDVHIAARVNEQVTLGLSPLYLSDKTSFTTIQSMMLLTMGSCNSVP